jgi:hypothetical protein
MRPTEVLSFLMSSLFKINALLEGSGCGGGVREMQGVQGQLTSSQGPHHEQGIAFPSKIFIIFSKYAPA